MELGNSRWFLNILTLSQLVATVASNCYLMLQFSSSKKGRVREDVTWPTSVGLSWSMWAACPGSVVIADPQVLAHALKENSTLKRLNLAYNKIGVEGVKAWCRDCMASVCPGIGPEKLSWYSSGTVGLYIAVAWGKDCVMMEGVQLRIVDIMVIFSRLHGSLCKFLVAPLPIKMLVCCFSAATPYQYMCSCVASPQYVVAWFVEASHCVLRVLELTAWVSYLFWLRSMYQTESLKAPIPWPDEIGGIVPKSPFF